MRTAVTETVGSDVTVIKWTYDAAEPNEPVGLNDTETSISEED